jgi:hydrogenase/urease accessory protein HupE
MMTPTFKLAFAATLLGSGSIAVAHPGHHASVPGYHYLTHPDHVVIFVLLGLSAASLLVHVMRRGLRAAKQRRD